MAYGTSNTRPNYSSTVSGKYSMFGIPEALLSDMGTNLLDEGYLQDEVKHYCNVERLTELLR